MSLSRRMPLFPLGLVLFPGERLPLHIFEPRYKEMVNRCLEEKAPFGIILLSDGVMARTGCSAYIERVLNRYDDGRMDIAIIGHERIRVLQLYSDASYLTADVEPLSEPEEELNKDQKERAITQHMRLLELTGRTVRPSVYQDVRHISYLLGSSAGLEPKDKQKMLEMLTENERIEFLTERFENLLLQVKKREELRKRIQSNGHVRDDSSQS